MKETRLIFSPSSAADLSLHGDGSVACIDAFDYLPTLTDSQAIDMIGEWARVIEDGGTLHLVVPDFEAIAKDYSCGNPCPDAQSMLLGTGVARASLWTPAKVRETIHRNGFWTVGEFEVDSGPYVGRHWIRLKAIRRKRHVVNLPMRDCYCAMSMPRLAFTENMDCVFDMCFKLGIGFTRVTGAFWGQCLTNALLRGMAEESVKYIITVDYDSVFDRNDVVRLYQIMENHPEYAACCSQQIHREKTSVLMTLDDGNGKPRTEVSYDETLTDILPILTGNFGLTFIRVEALKRLPQPWFLGIPNEDGKWDDGKVDDDIYFWSKMRKHGMKVGVAPQVRIGHMQLVVTWPTKHLDMEYQYISDYRKNGRKDECKTY